METKTFTKDGVTFRYFDSETGSLPFVFQHGIGGNLENVVSLFKMPPEIRLISFDARAHGETHPVGELSKLNLSTFVDDLIFLLDHLKVSKAVIGGMSMGAALGLNVGIRYPERAKGLVLYRPAWFDNGMTASARGFYQQLVDLLRGFGPSEGQKRFMESESYKTLQKNFPDTAKSLASQFLAKKAEEYVIRFEKLPYQSVVNDTSEISAINLPTLVISTKLDPVHPYEYGKCLSTLIPHSTFIEASPKSVNVEKHIAESQAALNAFLQGLS